MRKNEHAYLAIRRENGLHESQDLIISIVSWLAGLQQGIQIILKFQLFSSSVEPQDMWILFPAKTLPNTGYSHYGRWKPDLSRTST